MIVEMIILVAEKRLSNRHGTPLAVILKNVVSENKRERR